jgi:lysozyme
MELLTRLVAAFEGYRARKYLCPAGKWTQGYGHVIRPGETLPESLSHSDALVLLGEDLDDARRDVERIFRGIRLADHECDALTSFCMNLGADQLESSTLKKRVLESDRLGASREFTRWVWATDPATGMKVKLPGLVKRRDVESVLFLGASPFTVARVAGVPLEGAD